jgi:Zn-dependent protease with chaperone function
MDFFTAQDRARRRTRVLVGLFALSILGVITAIYLPANLLMGEHPGRHDLGLFLKIAIPISAFILAGTGWRLRSLRAGGTRVAALMGARPVLPNASAEADRRLLNITEEMALASGIPVPAVFVLDREEGINAFAAGHTIHDAAVVVTRGCLERLDRDELQGVIAHEFSHILNGDMRLNIRIMGVLHGLLLLTIVGRGIIRGAGYGRRTRSRDAGSAMAMGLALMIVGYLGVFFGKLIKAGISRQREYLADAAAVQFTRNPRGLAGALKKIAMLHPGSVVEDHNTEELNHAFFASAMRETWLSVPLFATHPAVEDRIRRIHTGWDGRFEVKVPEIMKERAAAERSRRLPGEGIPAMARMGLPVAAAMASMGAPAAVNLAYARQLLDRIPAPVAAGARDGEGAQALVLALLLDDEDDAVRDRQLRIVAELGGAALVAAVDEAAAGARAAGPDARLALLDLALPALRILPEPRATALRRTAQRMIREDGSVRMFDYAVVHVLARHLPAGPRTDSGLAQQVHSFQPVREHVQLVLSALAHTGAQTEEQARAAFAAAVSRLPDGVQPVTLQSRDTIGLARMDRALQHLERAAPGVRRRLVDACAHCVAFDGQVLPAEAETLRAVAEALDCPLPPLAPTISQSHLPGVPA